MHVSSVCTDRYLRASMRACEPTSGGKEERRECYMLPARDSGAGEKLTRAQINAVTRSSRDTTRRQHYGVRSATVDGQKCLGSSYVLSPSLSVFLPSRPPAQFSGLFVQVGQPTMSRGTARSRRWPCASFSSSLTAIWTRFHACAGSRGNRLRR